MDSFRAVLALIRFMPEVFKLKTYIKRPPAMGGLFYLYERGV